MKRKQISWAFALVILVLTMSLNPEQVAANNYNPIAVINLSGNSTTVSPGIPITFDGTQSYDPDNTNIIAYNWWYVDGVVKSQGSTADKKMFSYNFTLPAGVNSKTFQIKLTVRDNEYTTASKTITVTVHNGIAQTEYYLTDHLGSIRTTIDQYGTVIGFDDYDPFGNVLPGRSYNLGTPNDLNKFTGHERDQEGGLDLDYMLARNYDSELGRFYSVDPLQFMYSSTSSYSYVLNNPINLIDPTGMSSTCMSGWATKYYDEENKLVFDDGNDNGLEVHTESSIINGHTTDGVVDWDGVRNDPKSSVNIVDEKKYDSWVQDVSNSIQAMHEAVKISTDRKGNITYITSDEAAMQLYLSMAIYLFAPELIYISSRALFGIIAAKGGLKPLGLGSTAKAGVSRVNPVNLTEELAMKEIMSNPSMGRVMDGLKKGMTDKRWHKDNGWVKMSWNNGGVEIHYVGQWQNGVLKAVDDFKIIGQ